MDYSQQEIRGIISRNQHSKSYGLIILTRCLLYFFTAFSIAAFFYDRSVQWVFISPVLLGLGGYRVQFILHDTSHYSLFGSKRFNSIVGTAAGLLVGVDFRRYRFTHMWHHRRNGEPEDPQFPDYLGGGIVNKVNFLKFLLAPIVGGRFIPYLKREMGERDVSGHSAPKSGLIWWLGFFCIQTGLFAVSYKIGGKPEFMFFYYVGLATTALFLARIRTLAEHQQIPSISADFSRSHNWNFIDWVLFYEANFNLHVEHHMFPNLQTKYLKNVSAMLKNTGKLSDEYETSVFKTLRSLYSALPK